MSTSVSKRRLRSGKRGRRNADAGTSITLLCVLAPVVAGLVALRAAAQTPAKPTPVDGPGSTYSQATRSPVPNSPALPYGLALMSRFDLLPTLRDTKCVMDSSYEHNGGNGDADHFLRKEGNKAILSDIRGPGCIYRFWSANAAGHLRIFFDGETTPTIDCPMQDLFLGKVAPFVAPLAAHKSGGWFSFFPMPFQKSCRIEVTDPGAMYYHVQYQLYPEGTPIKTFTKTLSAEDKQNLDKVVKQWNHLGDDPKERLPNVSKNRGKFSLQPGAVKAFSTIDGAGEITALRMKVTPASRLSLRQTVLRVYWDDAKKPGIEAPVGDFFGIGFGDRRYKALPAAMKDDGYVCYWPMPFGKHARFELANLGTEPLQEVAWSIDYNKLKTPRPNVGYFHAQWHRQTTATGEHYHILEATGRGLYVGEHTDMQGDHGIGFLEGDEKLYADHEVFPAIYGTGTEDFYTGGWYFDEGPFNWAYHGCTVKSDDFSRISAYRYQIQDCVPFQQSLKVDIEHGGVNDYPGADYASVAFWYLDAPSHDWSPIDPKQLTPTYLKANGILEAEALSWTGGTTRILPDALSPNEASGGRLTAITGAGGAFKFTAPADDYYRLSLSSLGQIDSPSEVKVRIDQMPTDAGRLSAPKPDGDGHSDTSALVKLSKGEHTATIDVPAGKTLYLDYIKLEPSKKERGVVEAESLAGRADTGGKETVTVAPANVAFSGYSALRWNPKSTTSYLKLPVTVDKEGDFTLELGVGRLPNSARIAAQIDTMEPLATVETVDKATDGRKNVRLGDNLHLTAGSHVLTLLYKGEDPAATSPTLLLDYVRLMKSRYPFSFEAEGLRVLDHKDGDAQTQEMAAFGHDWSGDAQFWLTGSKAGAEATLELPVQTAGKFTLVVYYTTAIDYGIVQTLIDGQPVGDPTDCFSQGVKARGRVVLGAVDLTAGPHRITFRAVDKNAAGTGYKIGVDAIGLEPIK
jgi:hypothetical protein